MDDRARWAVVIGMVAFIVLGSQWRDTRAAVRAAADAARRAEEAEVVRDSLLGPEPLRAPMPVLLTDSIYCVQSRAFGQVCTSEVPPF